MPRPRRSRVYQNHHMDGTRWDWFRPRRDDVVVATSYKAGTTWMQSIVANLVFQGEELPQPLGQLSPWLDLRTMPLELVLGTLEAQGHRRFVKTHLPLDGLRFFEELRYVYVARDARDVFMSLWNHYANYTAEARAALNAVPGRVGDELPPPPEDPHVFWQQWMTRGWFEWESDGWPYWSHLHNVRTWWEYRQLPNVLLVHFQDLLDDLAGEVRRVASFLGLEGLSEAVLARVVQNTGFEAMKARAETYAPGGGSSWRGGAGTFLHRGTNGRWRELLDEQELALYEAACARVLSPDCRRWLESGGQA